MPTLPRARGPRIAVPSRGDLGYGAVALGLALVGAVTVVENVWIGLVALAIIAAMFVMGLRDWRRSFVGLVVFLPYSGILIIASYPATGPATLLKDLLFVIPAYLGFFGARALRGQSVAVPGFPLGFALAFAGIVFLQLLAPTLPNVVVGLIGAKVWLMYIPLAFVTYHYLRTRADLDRLLTILAVAAIIPCVVGVVEGILVNTGHGDTVYSWYGDAAAAATQQFVNVGVGSATINRVPSTFSFVGQYSLFTIISLSVAYAWWKGVLVPKGGRAPLLGIGLLGLVTLAALLSGARGTVLAVPALMVVMLALDGIQLRTWILAPIVLFLAFFAAASVFGTGIIPLVQDTWEHAISEFDIGTVQGVQHAFEKTYMGLGTGVDTVSARYGLPDFNPYGLVGGRVEESWWIKALLEVGIVGFLLVAALMLSVLRAALKAHAKLRDPSLRSISAAMFALMAYAVFFCFKGSALDLDPMNVMFWVFVGIALRLPVLQREEDAARAASGDGDPADADRLPTPAAPPRRERVPVAAAVARAAHAGGRGGAGRAGGRPLPFRR